MATPINSERKERARKGPTTLTVRVPEGVAEYFRDLGGSDAEVERLVRIALLECAASRWRPEEGPVQASTTEEREDQPDPSA